MPEHSLPRTDDVALLPPDPVLPLPWTDGVDPATDNYSRARRALVALRAYPEFEPEGGLRQNIRDLMADLLHLAEQTGDTDVHWLPGEAMGHFITESDKPPTRPHNL